MLNTPTDKKLSANPIIVSSYFDDFSNLVAPIPPETFFILSENGDFITDESGNRLITE